MPKRINMKQTSYTEPLFIDTTLEYKIDRSRFPGIDNGEPMLLVHSSTNCLCTQVQTNFIAPAADHELFTMIDTLADVVAATEQIQPENEPNTCCFGLSPVSPIPLSRQEDLCCDFVSDYPKDRDYQSLDSPLNTLDVLFDFDSSSSSDSHLSALLDDQLFPSFYNPHDPAYLLDDFSIICDVDLCIMKTRKRRHSTVYEDSPKRRRTECCWVADLFEEDADLRWSS